MDAKPEKKQRWSRCKEVGKSPSQEELDEMFAAMVENGLKFFKKAAAELAGEPEHSVAHFATGLELVLKARLFKEHWTLLADKPLDARWQDLNNGRGKTIAAGQLLQTLKCALGLLDERACCAFEDAFRHRNRVLHLRPHPEKRNISSEQCLAWYYLNNLLVGPWKGHFLECANLIDDIEANLKGHNDYLKAKLDFFLDIETVKETFDKATKEGRVLECRVCHLPAVIVEHLASCSFIGCWVCETNEYCVALDCGCFYSTDGSLNGECKKGNEHTPPQIHESLSPVLNPKEEFCTDEPLCAHCDGEHVLKADELCGWLCLDCWEFSLEKKARCEACGQAWVGCSQQALPLFDCSVCNVWQ